MAEKFGLRAEIERYALHLSHGIRSPKRRREVAEEYADHIEDLIRAHTVRGVPEGEAFRLAREELGDSLKISELEAAVHNRDPLPSWLSVPLWILGAVLLVASYYVIPSSAYRAWFAFVCNVGLTVLWGYFFYFVYLFARALDLRREGVKKLKKYAREHGMTLRKNRSPYFSLLRRGGIPELTLETETAAYHLSLFATVKKRKSLYLYDCGLYSYSDHVGYMMLYTRHLAFTGPIAFLPVGMRYFPAFHSERVEVPRGMHLTPRVDWDAVAHPEKENVKVLLLSPIPFRVHGVVQGVKHELGDNKRFGDLRVFSFTGFHSYLEGLRISGRRRIDE